MIFKGDKNLWTLLDFKFSRHFKAEHGGDGSKNRSTGADGKDCVIRVPLGTVIVDNDSGEKLTEIVDEKEVVAIKGGKGCLLYTSPSPRDATLSRMPSSA